jgi:hypothetical protein
METAENIRSELKDLRSQLHAIDEKEATDTELMIRDLKSCVASIEKKELDENEAMLRNMAVDVVNVEKTEFSLMKILGIESNELVHSNFLAWLLDPLESHRLGSRFVEEFLGKVATRTCGFDSPSLDFSNLRVDREVTGDESRLDIRIWNPRGSFQCVIENKILSGEGADQTDRLYRTFHDKSSQELFVFLALDETAKPKNGIFKSLPYREVLPILQILLQVSRDADTRFLIRNYVNTLERLIVSENFEGFSERTKLYYKYQKCINDVRKAFDQDRKLILKTLEDGIKQRPWWNSDLWDMLVTGGSVCIWKKAWYKGEDGVYLLVEASTGRQAYHLYVFGEPSQFSEKFAPVFERLLDQEYSGKVPGGFSKTFARGVTRFIQKDVQLSLAGKDQPQELLKNLDEMLRIFEKTIDRSIAEFRKK